VRGRPQWHVRSAETADLPAAARLLHDFNAEFDDLTPAPTEIAARLEVLIAAGDTVVLVGGAGPDGLAVLRLRPNLWTPRLECYLAEFYVRPPLRGGGLGRALLEATLAHARAVGADRIELGTSQDDVAAMALYESMGFINREGGPDGPVMYVYELDL